MEKENPTEVRFVEVTVENLAKVCKLSNTLSPGQKLCVATNAFSVAEAHFFPDVAWYRAIAVADDLIGFIMFHTAFTEGIPPEHLPCAFLWRFMIARPYQKKGYGKKALDLLVEKVKNEGYKSLYTSCHVARVSPYKFYLRYGFVDTGVVDDGEEVLKFCLIPKNSLFGAQSS